MSCRHHLAVEVSSEFGSIKMVHGHLDLEQLAETCALDVADRGEHAHQRVGDVMAIGFDRVRQIERWARQAIAKERADLKEHVEGGSDAPEGNYE